MADGGEEVVKTVTFTVTVTSAGPFPEAVQPLVKIVGFGEAVGAALEAEAAEDFEAGLNAVSFEKPAGLPLCDEAATPGALKIQLCDGDVELLSEPIAVDLYAFLHEKTEISVPACNVTLAPEVDRKWEGTEEEPKTRLPTSVSLSVASSELLAPAEDREGWNLMSLPGIVMRNVPPALLNCFTPGAKGMPNIPGLAYTVNILGEKIPAVQVTEEVPPAAAGEEPGSVELIGLQEPAWVRYRGAAFMNKLKACVNDVGGTYVTVSTLQAENPDPKYKPPADAPALVEKYKFRAYVDLRPLLGRGVDVIQTTCDLIQPSGEPFLDDAGEDLKPTLELGIKFHTPLVRKERPPPPEIAELVSDKVVSQKLRGAGKVKREFTEAVKECIQPASSSNAVGGNRPERLVEIRIRDALLMQITEHVRKGLTVDAGDQEAFISKVFAELASQVVPESLRDAGLACESVKENAFTEVTGQRSVLTRSRRLLKEAELCGNVKTAANFWQQILAIDETKNDPVCWLEYAQFLQRVGGKSEAAEFAVRRAIDLCEASGGASSSSSSVTSGSAPSSPTAIVLQQSRTMLAALLLDRRRFADAEGMLRSLCEENRADSMANFLRGLCVYLRGNDVEGGQNWFILATKPKDWFRGLNSEEKVMEKLALFLSAGDAMSTVTGTGTYASAQTATTLVDSVSGSFAGSAAAKPSLEASNVLVVALEKLVTFGCAKLIFTVLDKEELSSVIAFGHDGLSQILEAECYMLQHDLQAAKKVLSGPDAEAMFSGDAGVDCARCRILGEALFRLGEFEEAQVLLQMASESPAFRPEVFGPVYVRLGHCYLLQSEYDLAKEVFLQNVRIFPTSEAWVGLAFSSYRQDQISQAYEALREALWLDDERPDVWAFLTMVHLRMGNLIQADDCFRHTMYYTSDHMSDELLLEVGVEFLKCEEHESGPYRAECAARTALALRETGQAHEVLADALSVQQQFEKAVLEYAIAIRLFYDAPDRRALLVEKALHITDEVLHDAPLAESVHIAEKMALSHAAEVEKKSHLQAEATA
ncbi:unnamed protein product [Amoebophrya sp. A25]|nr:unnamed protein product [Amoebophrya sp. A25]|eukprot:GSA25T00022558001.1